MIFKNKVVLMLMTVLPVSFLTLTQTVFAEGTKVCNGNITGTTTAASPAYNVNSGVISFDGHPNVNGLGGSVDVSIATGISGSKGLAPAAFGEAACINEERAKAYNQDYEYALKGWAWNTNGGFVSFACKNKVNNGGGADVACGDYDYGVYIGAVDVSGNRNLFGYAWNPTFGYMQFNDNDPADAIKYGVKIDRDGKSSGYAWTQAGTYVEFSGLTLNLKGAVVPAGGGVNKGWCYGKAGICVEIDPDPAASDFGGVKIADGVDGYDLHLYFRDQSGVGINPTAGSTKIVNLDKIAFNWLDTVKTDQVSEKSGAADAVLNKSVWPGDFALVAGETGHYKTTKKIVSYAPTSESKLSWTTGTKPAYLVNNESFVYPPEGVNLPVQTNQLKLKSISFPNLIDVGGNILIPMGNVYPNGNTNLLFKFRPAVFVETLYANALQDTISAYRSVPFVVKRGLKKIGSLGPITKDSVKFYVTYSGVKAQTQCQGLNSVYNFDVIDFLEGSDVGSASSNVEISSPIDPLLDGVTFDLRIDPAIPSYTEGDAVLPCAIATGANIYSKISYTVANKKVSYYDNKLPRIDGGSIVNPAVVVHGNIFAQAAGNVRNDQRVQTSGSVNINLVRDAINENLKKYVSKQSLDSIVTGKCTITKMNESLDKKTGQVDADCASTNYLLFDVGTEHVLYSKGDVTLSFQDGNWVGRWVVIVDGGNIFVDNNLYVKDTQFPKMSLITFRSSVQDNYYQTGNIYIAPTVTNIQGTFMVDGTLFSYDGIHGNINNGKKDDKGEPKWTDYSSMLKTLNTQLLIEGALYSDNTIGGANLDQGKNPKNYLLAGGGQVLKLPATIEKRMKAQYYDLNYLRMFRLSLELGEDGLPIDQRCGKSWTADDQVKLLNIMAKDGSTAAVCGTKAPCDPVQGGLSQKTACNGIDPLLKYNETTGEGDLIVPASGVALVQGLNANEDYDPVYIYYKAPDEGSFVFSKAGAASISGK